jgi:hypothetical protein
MQTGGATITVTNTNDSGPGSLRQALMNANDGDKINCAVTGNIALTSGGLVIDKNVTISGPGANELSIDGNQGDFVFAVDPDKTATISGLTIRTGQFGIGNVGTLTVSDCTVSGNSSVGLSNIANGQASTNATLTIANSIVSDNSGPGVSNGAFMASATVTILNSTLTGNGGGIYTSGFEGGTNVTVSNSTISGNSADLGGGIYSYWSAVTIVNSTLSGNSAGSGGGIYNGGGLFGGIDVEISNTILNAGASGENIFNNGGTITSHGYNLSSDDGAGYLTGPGDQINTDPLLGPLQDNGGPTLTHMPLPGSPVIDAGDPNFTSPPFRDQRGACFHRVFRRIDIGSVETQPERPCPIPRPRPTPR